MSNVKPHRSEADVKKSIMELLKRMGIMSFRMQSADMLYWRNGKKYRIVMNPKGTADILALVKHGTSTQWEVAPCWIEVKSDSGRQSKEQVLFQFMVEAEGHIYILARSADEVHNELSKIGT